MVPVVFISGFLVIFGIFYLHYSTRNRERLALIEKGADASVFVSKRSTEAPPVWKILLLNLGLLIAAIGLGIMITSILVYEYQMEEEVGIGLIFLLSGLSLILGFFLTRKLIK